MQRTSEQIHSVISSENVRIFARKKHVWKEAFSHLLKQLSVKIMNQTRTLIS